MLQKKSLILIVFSLTLSHPATAIPDCLARWITKTKVLRENDFPISRKIEDYGDFFKKDVSTDIYKPPQLRRLFEEFLPSLKRDDLWIDLGAGNGVALQEYIDNYENGASVIGIALVRGRNVVLKNGPRAQYVEANAITAKIRPGSASLTTDIYGPFTYSLYPDRVLNSNLKSLKVGGRTYIVAPNNMKVIAGGRTMNTTEWLKSRGSGFSMLDELTVGPLGGPYHRAYILEKTEPDAQIPILRLTGYDLARRGSKFPEERRYRESATGIEYPDFCWPRFQCGSDVFINPD